MVVSGRHLYFTCDFDLTILKIIQPQDPKVPKHDVSKSIVATTTDSDDCPPSHEGHRVHIAGRGRHADRFQLLHGEKRIAS